MYNMLTFILIYKHVLLVFEILQHKKDKDLNKSSDFLLNPFRIYVCITRNIYMFVLLLYMYFIRLKYI